MHAPAKTLALLLLLQITRAFPHLGQQPPAIPINLTARQTESDFDSSSDTGRVGAAPKLVYPRIDTSGEHAWKPPGPNDKHVPHLPHIPHGALSTNLNFRRGPCPALNALANHGYLDRSGIVNLLTGPKIISDIYGLGLELSILLSVYATLMAGNIVTQTWSIGGGEVGKQAGGLLGGVIGGVLTPLLGQGRGLSGSHNKYETDASVGRGDFALYNGDVDTLQMDKFKALLDLQRGVANPNWSFDVLAKHRTYTLHNSISTNPYFYFGPFSGLLVSNAGHCFVPAMFSNNSAAHGPDGILTRSTLLAFFAVVEQPNGALTHNKGWERIPDNWYRRPLGKDYGSVAFALDLVRMAAITPGILRVGGNTGTVNSFSGVDVGDLTGGAFRLLDLLDPRKLVCYIFQTTMVIVPDALQGGLVGSVLGLVYELLNKMVAPLIDNSCPRIAAWNGKPLKQFPGSGLGS
ncbi:hypothetical protein EDC01DRAFT_633576 [Geopyxis carbonaria]|nr:hypothetical protein EDC01DRAFT_633576 [Geopyxis carbonaria]